MEETTTTKTIKDLAEKAGYRYDDYFSTTQYTILRRFTTNGAEVDRIDLLTFTGNRRTKVYRNGRKVTAKSVIYSLSERIYGWQ